MTIKTGYKINLFLVIVLTAVVLCTLPFWTSDKNTVYIYTSKKIPNKEERNFIEALKEQGITVKINDVSKAKVAIWFRKPEQVTEISQKKIKYNFLYTSAHYPFAWQKLENPPIMLTPHQDLYEHYTRSNIKTAHLTISNPKPAAIKFLEILNWLKHNTN
ncbi:MAG: hypothetical protein NC218_11180 [Acetobacter sp.]|nr:hypothetical protein [Acetobacter sp.]